MNDAGLSIIAAECKRDCAGQSDFVERIRKAMRPVANGHWMYVNDEDLCFRGAVAGVLLAEETTDEEKKRLIFTLEQLRSMGAMMSGVPVDIEAVFANPEGIEPVPLVKLWHEVKSPPEGAGTEGEEE